MSHFVMGVIVPKNVENVDQYIDNLLAPYDEQLEVAPYMTRCYCVGDIARKDAHNIASKSTKSIEQCRDEYWKMPELDRPEWDEFIKPYITAKDEAFNKHPLKDSPDGDCEECHGTGEYSTTYNEDSHWDWFQVGGRWTGMWADYDPSTDPDNIEECATCNGTGMRMDDLGIETRKKDPTYKCNGCGGTGKSVKFASHWKKCEGDVQPVENVVNMILSDREKYMPFGFVTPDGVWHEEGNMGWWGIVRDKKESPAWYDECIELLKKHMDCNIVVVDCHI